jgi:hypothetical protein
MRLSALGSLTGWTISTTAYLVWPHPAVVGLGVLVGATFMLLLLAHGVAFTARIVALWETMRAGASSDVQELWPSRRVFLLSLLGAGLAALLPSVSGRAAVRASGTSLIQPSELRQAAYTCKAEVLTGAADISGDATLKVGETKDYCAVGFTPACGSCSDGSCDEKLDYKWFYHPAQKKGATPGHVKIEPKKGKECVKVTGEKVGTLELQVEIELTCGEKKCKDTDVKTLRLTLTVTP